MQMLMTSPNHIPATRRMHVGKELEQFESIDWYDNEARFYDPLLVRFTTPDPLALSYPSLSPPTPTAQTTRYATWTWMERKYVLQKECPQNSNSNSLQR